MYSTTWHPHWTIPKTYICYPRGCAAPGEVPCQCNTRRPLSKLKRNLPQRKINVTSKSPVGDISVVTLIRTDTTLDHSQKAEKVWCHRQKSESRLSIYMCILCGGQNAYSPTIHSPHTVNFHWRLLSCTGLRMQ